MAEVGLMKYMFFIWVSILCTFAAVESYMLAGQITLGAVAATIVGILHGVVAGVIDDDIITPRAVWAGAVTGVASVGAAVMVLHDTRMPRSVLIIALGIVWSVIMSVAVGYSMRESPRDHKSGKPLDSAA